LTAEWRVVLAGLRPGDRPGPAMTLSASTIAQNVLPVIEDP
jgi:hypothetical protein